MMDYVFWGWEEKVKELRGTFCKNQRPTIKEYYDGPLGEGYEGYEIAKEMARANTLQERMEVLYKRRGTVFAFLNLKAIVWNLPDIFECSFMDFDRADTLAEFTYDIFRNRMCADKLTQIRFVLTKRQFTLCLEMTRYFDPYLMISTTYWPE